MYKATEKVEIDDGVMGWEQRFCPSQFCTADALVVQRRPDQEEVWEVACSPADSPWLVAAAVPVCPFCGANLLTPAELDEGVRSHEENVMV